MATQRLTWDDTGKRLYETGVKQGVFYPQDDNGTYPKGIAWNGLTAVTESPEGAEPTPLYADDILEKAGTELTKQKFIRAELEARKEVVNPEVFPEDLRKDWEDMRKAAERRRKR